MTCRPLPRRLRRLALQGWRAVGGALFVGGLLALPDLAQRLTA